MPTRQAVKATSPRTRASSSSSHRPPRRRGAAARAKRRSRVVGTLMVSVAVAAVVLIAGSATAGALVVYGLNASASTSDPKAPVLPAPRPPGVAGYDVEQLANACTIMAAGRDLGLSTRDQTIAVMTAMGESSLRNIDYGDWETSGVTNPDGSPTTSIGLFQQQDGWGSRETRLDPYRSAGLFYRAMTARVPDRADLEPTLIAHRTQINADPQHYARYWDRALRIVAALNEAPIVGDVLDGIETCPAR